MIISIIILRLFLHIFKTSHSLLSLGPIGGEVVPHLQMVIFLGKNMGIGGLWLREAFLFLLIVFGNIVLGVIVLGWLILFWLLVLHHDLFFNFFD